MVILLIGIYMNHSAGKTYMNQIDLSPDSNRLKSFGNAPGLFFVLQKLIVVA